MKQKIFGWIIIVACSIGMGIMSYSAQQTINIGSAPNDGTGDPARTAFTKTNANFTELYSTTATHTTQIGTNTTNIATNTTNIASNTSAIAAINARTYSLGISIDGAGSAITTGTKGYLYVPYACTITAVTMLADVSGSAVVDIWKDTYANYPPTIADTITASAKPTISSAVKSTDSTLTGWTKSVSAGDTIAFNVDSAATITRLNLVLTVTRP